MNESEWSYSEDRTVRISKKTGVAEIIWGVKPEDLKRIVMTYEEAKKNLDQADRELFLEFKRLLSLERKDRNVNALYDIADRRKECLSIVQKMNKDKFDNII